MQRSPALMKQSHYRKPFRHLTYWHKTVVIVRTVIIRSSMEFVMETNRIKTRNWYLQLRLSQETE